MNLTRRRLLSVSATDRLSAPPHLLAISASIIIFLSLSGCTERSEELDERVTVLQKELDNTETQLQAANQSLKAAREELARLRGRSSRPSESMAAQATPAAKLPPREALEKSYTEGAKTLKQQLQDRLQNYTIGTCTLRNIDVASPEYPVTSTLSISLRPNGGSPFQLDLPAKADRTGKWSFPELTEVIGRIEDIARSSTRVSSNRPSQSSATSSSGQPADRTAVVRWPDSGSTAREPSSSNTAPPPTSAMQGEGQMQSQAGPAANQTFVVRWPDSGGGASQRNPSAAASPRGPTAPGQKPTSTDQDVLTQF
jgi:uncharacterized small protein (DUF1192 family)